MPDKTSRSATFRNISNYLTQVSLIILSILVAVGVDRCNQRNRDEDRLQEYILAIHQEIADEKVTTANNLGDAHNDIDDLEFAVENLSATDEALLTQAIQRLVRTVGRGVFRAFPPSAYEQLIAAGDVNLIREIDLRDRLAATAAFRKDYIQEDLANYDGMVLELVDRLSRYLDMGCLIRNRAREPIGCIRKADNLREDAPSDISKIYRMAQLRAFHLELYQKSLDKTAMEVAKNYGPPPLSADAASAPPAPPSD